MPRCWKLPLALLAVGLCIGGVSVAYRWRIGGVSVAYRWRIGGVSVAYQWRMDDEEGL